MLAAACGGDETASTNQEGGATVSVASVGRFGNVLVDSSGKALYSADEEADGSVRCIDACASFWTPLSTDSAMPSAAAGVPSLGLIERPDGSQQVTAAGRPLYTFTQDSPGAITGDGFSDDFGSQHFTWHVVLADDAAVSPATSPNSGVPGY
jgi:predicted lipoprotein with Yx(FWY)xxD motif